MTQEQLIREYELWNHNQYCNKYCFNCSNFMNHNFAKMYQLGILECEYNTFHVERLHEKGLPCPDFKPTFEYKLNQILHKKRRKK